MKQHLVYINDRPLRFAAFAEMEGVRVNKEGYVISESEFSIEEVVNGFTDYPFGQEVIYLCNDPDVSWKNFVSLFTLSVAAGGVVRNPENNLLVIFRRGKWDLPKGKLDYDETPEHAAVREVKEECGLEEVILGVPLMNTFHTYTEKKKMILKKTHWYTMTADASHDLVPQLEEDIEQAVWMSAEQVRAEVYANTYRSVRAVLDEYFSRG
jgi:8-oxo-dGTP pyrophosphatase MutT (NUDIX family)